MTFTSVVLPAPFAPTTDTISPRATSNDTSRSTLACPYCAPTASTLSKQELLAEIRLDHRGRLGGRWRRPLKDLLAVVQHDDHVRERHHGLHHVLDHQERDAARAEPPEPRHHPLDLGGRQPRHDLVEEDQLRLRGHGSGDF